jgi:hypothetical protein
MDAGRNAHDKRDLREKLARTLFEETRASLWEETTRRQLADFPALTLDDLKQYQPAFDAKMELHWPEWKQDAHNHSIDELRMLVEKERGSDAQSSPEPGPRQASSDAAQMKRRDDRSRER